MRNPEDLEQNAGPEYPDQPAHSNENAVNFNLKNLDAFEDIKMKSSYNQYITRYCINQWLYSVQHRNIIFIPQSQREIMNQLDIQNSLLIVKRKTNLSNRIHEAI